MEHIVHLAITSGLAGRIRRGDHLQVALPIFGSGIGLIEYILDFAARDVDPVREMQEQPEEGAGRLKAGALFSALTRSVPERRSKELGT